MNNMAQEWVEKAEGDYVTATELLHLYIKTTADSICFHCQQCAEKYIKAYLLHHSIQFSPAQPLLDLLVPCLHNDNSFLTISSEIRLLSGYGIEILYPGLSADLQEAERVARALEVVRAFVRSKLAFIKK